jgi:hypothetical protein
LRFRDILTDPVRLFRALVIISTGSYLIWFFQLLLGGRLISPGVWGALAWEDYGAVLQIPPGLTWLFMLFSVAVAVGLYRFSKSARIVFTMMMAFSALLALLSGVSVQTAFGSFLGHIGALADGAILVMAYTSPLKEEFD